MQMLIRITLLAGIFGLSTLTVDAATYKYNDESGNPVYSSTPPTDGRKYEKIKADTPRGGGDETESPATTTTPAASSAPSSSSKDTVKKELEKNRAIREKNCEISKKNLEAYTVFRRVMDKDGKAIYLDDNERAKKIEEAKKGVEEFCD